MSGFVWRLAGKCHKFGDNIDHVGPVMPKWLVSGVYMDPNDLIPHLFEELRPGFPDKVKAGDIIVTGKNFGMGPKMHGYIAMHALGMGLLTESMPFLGYRAALACGLRVLDNCPGITDLVEDGDEVEADFRSGEFINHTRGHRRHFAGTPAALQEITESGGMRGFLRNWREREPVREPA